MISLRIDIDICTGSAIAQPMYTDIPELQAQVSATSSGRGKEFKPRWVRFTEEMGYSVWTPDGLATARLFPTIETEIHHLEGAVIYAGLDVCLASVSICIIDEAGLSLREGIVAAEPADIAAYLAPCGTQLARVGLEAGPMAE